MAALLFSALCHLAFDSSMVARQWEWENQRACSIPRPSIAFNSTEPGCLEAGGNVLCKRAVLDAKHKGSHLHPDALVVDSANDIADVERPLHPLDATAEPGSIVTDTDHKPLQRATPSQYRVKPIFYTAWFQRGQATEDCIWQSQER